MEEVKKELVNCLLDKKIRIEYIPKYETIYNVANSPAKEGMHVESKWSYPCFAERGERVKFLTDDEIEFLGSELNADLSFPVDSDKPCFWSYPKFRLPTLSVRSFELDLSKPMDYIYWKALKCWPIIASRPEDERERPREVRWRMIDTEETKKFKSKSGKDKAAAWRTYGQFEQNREVLIYVYYNITGKAYNYKEVTQDDLYGYFEPIMDSNAATFVFQIEQPNIKFKGLLHCAWMANIITKKSSGFYYIKDDVEIKLFKDGEEGTLEDAANFLLNPVNQKFKFEIEALFEKYKNS